ncbi:tetratricopeptide repeat protein [Streptomyces sp. NPDC014636]|uniref:tetratricopeptide repeat protein n=1 Tax=Streptomyces sp. NPDC014636 TaxID=3364876 RepID=UPI0036FBB2D6
MSEGLPEGRSPLTGDHVDFRQAEFHGQVIGVQIQHAYGARPPIVLPVPGDWPTATALEPLAHGVLPARRMKGRPPLPPYVPRDADAALVAALASAAVYGGLVVVLGEPYAGKSRTALAVLAAALPGARVYAPDAGTDLRGLPEVLRGAPGLHVLWLDDLGGHLGDGGLEPRLLARLAGLKVVVLATLREDAYDEHRQTPRGGVLDLAQIVELPREWTDAERARAAESGDGRLTEAAGLSGAEGIAAHLAVEPRLWADFERARRKHPRGQALVRAAIDLARCGLRGPLPQDLLVEVADGYGPLAGTQPETVEEALEWAARDRYGVLPLLRREGPRAWSAAGPLVGTARYDEKLPPVDGALWQRALDVARSGEGHDFELVATLAGAAFERGVQAGDRRAMYRLGLLEEAEGHQEEAESWFRRAAEAGVPEAAGRMGRLLVERGRSRDAEPFLEEAAQAGDGDAATLLAEALLDRAERWLRAARTPKAARLLGDLRFCVDDPEETWLRYTNAAGPRHPEVARSMGMHHLVVSETEIARAWLQRAVDAGDQVAAELLAELDREGPSLSDAEDYFRDTADYPLDIAHHGIVLEKLDRPDEAETRYRHAYEVGDSYGAYRLGALFDGQGKPQEARRWYRKAADLGHYAARKALGELSDGPDTVEE